MSERERRQHRELGLGKLGRLVADLTGALARGTSNEDLESWYLGWQAANEPAPFWTEAPELNLGEWQLELGEEGQAKRLELLWDSGESAPVLRVETGATRELHFVFRLHEPEESEEVEAGQEPRRPTLQIERQEFDALAPLNAQTGLLNMGINRRIRRKIDSRALRVELTRSIYERLKEQGSASHPTKMKRNDFYRALRELAEGDARYSGFTGLLQNYPLEQLVSEAYGSEPVDELGPQLFLPVLESYLPEPAVAELEPEQLRTGLWPTARPRASAVLDLELWILLQQARAMSENTWSVPLPSEALRPVPEAPREMLVECPLRESVPCRRGDLLTVEDSGNRRLGKLLVTSIGPEELCGRLRVELGAGDLRTAHGLRIVPIRSSYGRIARALEGIREGVAWKRDIALSPALRAFLGLEALPVHQMDKAVLDRRLRARSIAEDPSQHQALRWALDPRSPLVLIQGPPGTGKTTLIEEMCRQAVAAGWKVAVTGPSHPAVDNALRRLVDLPLLRVAAAEENLSDPLREFWTRAPGAERRFRQKAQRTGGFVIGGTHIGLLNDPTMATMSRNGLRFDLVIVDEAGMSRPEELLLSLELGDRGILIGDQQQLPPFPLSPTEIASLEGLLGRPLLRRDRALLEASALEILVEERGFPAVLLTQNYRCHNPRLVELSSQLFYDSRIHLAPCSEYFRLPYLERQQMLGPDSLRLYDTSALPLAVRSERTEWESGAPGYCSPMEAAILLSELERLLRHYRAEELCVISPYRLQVHLLRQALGLAARRGPSSGLALPQMLGLGSELALNRWLTENVTTIDSFQGRECDALLVSYVRSNRNRSSGFVGDPRRNNVTHTRARREMVIVGDLETLCGGATGPLDPLAVRSAYVFRRMMEIVSRHGVIVPLQREAPYSTGLELIWSTLMKPELQTSAS